MRARHDPGQWRAPAPLWDRTADPAPALLRFDTDDWMPRLLTTLATTPASIADALAAVETWQRPRVGADAAAADGDQVLPLYQPAQGRFYAVAATLACPRYGLPDRIVDRDLDESVGFLLRRVVGADEWGIDTSGAWHRATESGLVDDEEVHPLVAVSHPGTHGPRRLLLGLVPVSARERLQAADPAPEEDATGAGSPPHDPGPLADPRVAGLIADVVVPLSQAFADTGGLDAAEVAAGMRESVFFAALELARLLDAERGAGPALALDALLDAAFVPGTGIHHVSWREALAVVVASAEGSPTLDFDAAGPRPVRDRTVAELRDAVERLGVVAHVDPEQQHLTVAVAEALRPRVPLLGAAAATAEVGPLREAVELSGPALDLPTRPAAAPVHQQPSGPTYVVRCVHRRPRCPAPLDVTLSAPSRGVRLAGFFDTDAPARPVRITLPGDTSLQSLRRSPKPVSVVLGRQLKDQLRRASTVMDAPDSSPGGQIDWVMQLSIPIITICALLLLTIIVHVLHVVFWWLPAFVRWVPRFRPGGGS